MNTKLWLKVFLICILVTSGVLSQSPSPGTVKSASVTGTPRTQLPFTEGRGSSFSNSSTGIGRTTRTTTIRNQFTTTTEFVPNNRELALTIAAGIGIPLLTIIIITVIIVVSVKRYRKSKAQSQLEQTEYTRPNVPSGDAHLYDVVNLSGKNNQMVIKRNGPFPRKPIPVVVHPVNTIEEIRQASHEADVYYSYPRLGTLPPTIQEDDRAYDYVIRKDGNSRGHGLSSFTSTDSPPETSIAIEETISTYGYQGPDIVKPYSDSPVHQVDVNDGGYVDLH